MEVFELIETPNVLRIVNHNGGCTVATYSKTPTYRAIAEERVKRMNNAYKGQQIFESTCRGCGVTIRAPKKRWYCTQACQTVHYRERLNK